jgi:hypothetical protein
MNPMKITSLFLMLFVFFSACSDSPQTLDQQVDVLINEQKFDEALVLLNDQPASESVSSLKERVHLQHGIYLIYNADPSQMRENANNALREFIAVLEINPDNEKARAEIQQIINIYKTFQNRQPDEEVIKQLEELGFEV